MKKLIYEMTDETFDEARNSLIKLMAEKPKNLVEEFTRYQRILSNFSTEFDYRKPLPPTLSTHIQCCRGHIS